MRSVHPTNTSEPWHVPDTVLGSQAENPPSALSLARETDKQTSRQTTAGSRGNYTGSEAHPDDGEAGRWVGRFTSLKKKKTSHKYTHTHTHT